MIIRAYKKVRISESGMAIAILQAALQEMQIYKGKHYYKDNKTFLINLMIFRNKEIKVMEEKVKITFMLEVIILYRLMKVKLIFR